MIFGDGIYAIIGLLYLAAVGGAVVAVIVGYVIPMLFTKRKR